MLKLETRREDGGWGRKGEGREGNRDVAVVTSRVVESTDTYPLEDRQ